MGNSVLYKYLDADGGLMMLQKSNLQFTNATRLNDPFDCHPSLIDFSQVPEERMIVWDKELVVALEKNRFERLRQETWLCSLSKVHDSMLMWSYYGNHRGICIGIDMEKANRFLSNIRCKLQIGAQQYEVQYKEIIEKPDYFKGFMDYYKYLLSTKAKAWEHEQEVRLVLIEPSPEIMALRFKPKKEDGTIDWKETRAYPYIGNDCFDSLYLGINIDKEGKTAIIKEASKRNPMIKIYQMNPDPDSFKMKAVLI